MTQSEENYIKVIYLLSLTSNKGISSNAISAKMETKPSSATDMVKKLAEKKLVDYVKYQGVFLTETGKQLALSLVRKHRLWETFLVHKLEFSWDEVHEIAEELEHIKSEKLIDRLDQFLGFPSHDPHGDAIPDKDGILQTIDKILLPEAEINCTYLCVGVKDSSDSFLAYLDKINISLGTHIVLLAVEPFDQSCNVLINGKESMISYKIASNLFVKKA
ncbi:MAG: metal-dependent transcriptional regulator [Flavobacteriales bacterium]|nr:metal-dependent transcriptional regulator [Flavobacteriales bacterium]